MSINASENTDNINKERKEKVMHRQLCADIERLSYMSRFAPKTKEMSELTTLTAYDMHLLLQHIKLKPLFYLKSKNRSHFIKSKLKQKWEQNSSPITCEQNRIEEMEKEKSTRASKGSSHIFIA